MKKFIPLVLLALLVVLGGVFFYLNKKGNKGEIPSGYVKVLSLSEEGKKIDLYARDGKLQVGKNELFIVVKPSGSIESLYFYMPPMPGMGEMREDALLQKVKEGVYRGQVNISMAGQWQLVVQTDGKVIKKTLSIPLKASSSEESKTEGITIDPQKLQLIGIYTQEVRKQELMDSFNAVGYVSYDLSRVYEITLRSDGWVLDTFGRFEGELINRGTPLMRVVNPDVQIAKEELKLAKELGRKDLEKAVLEKLNYLKVGEVITSPYRGVILEKKVYAGGYTKAGDTAYKIADISSVWVIAEVPQEYSSLVKRGTQVLISPVGSEESFTGRVDYIFPEADRQARTIKVRISIPDKETKLKINQLVDVYFEKPLGVVLAVPSSAVVDTGKRQVVFVEKERGVYEPRYIRVGRCTQDMCEVLEGLKEGERVVVKGSFLLDSEAQIKGLYGEEAKSHEHHH
ncbi:efflux RND transporter periplasmic adaptor subunit [Hydrogenobacter hydrogenophilus]|uniref:Membrane fusion protein, Cu(I)/Ag(I) efflux system n=1 Tax=Hydrogenobacter hydrogenophilus TaxID=35835 RepID=A0A285NSN7_9AQUI|nr:efflux RND transporter periplasmic adaptor subunit [Hydrogenobacter hydrogenophilus]SNZ10866.1 membrane fusion protein, Cu(I)/Ag(I) efflux system [Hydrogenobacter hydrogenophilus]